MLLAVTLFGAQGCASWHPITPKTAPDDVAGNPVRGSYQGHPIEVRAVEVKGPVMKAKVPGPDGQWREVFVDLRAIDNPQALYRDTGEKVGLGIGIGVGSAAGLAVLSVMVASVFFGVAALTGGFSLGNGVR